jgi:hypothetical protein
MSGDHAEKAIVKVREERSLAGTGERRNGC